MPLRQPPEPAFAFSSAPSATAACLGRTLWIPPVVRAGRWCAASSSACGRFQRALGFNPPGFRQVAPPSRAALGLGRRRGGILMARRLGLGAWTLARASLSRGFGAERTGIWKARRRVASSPARRRQPAPRTPQTRRVEVFLQASTGVPCRGGSRARRWRRASSRRRSVRAGLSGVPSSAARAAARATSVSSAALRSRRPRRAPPRDAGPRAATSRPRGPGPPPSGTRRSPRARPSTAGSRATRCRTAWPARGRGRPPHLVPPFSDESPARCACRRTRRKAPETAGRARVRDWSSGAGGRNGAIIPLGVMRPVRPRVPPSSSLRASPCRRLPGRRPATPLPPLDSRLAPDPVVTAGNLPTA